MKRSRASREPDLLLRVAQALRYVVGDTAVAVIWQFLDRMALRPDNQVHHVQTWTMNGREA